MIHQLITKNRSSRGFNHVKIVVIAISLHDKKKSHIRHENVLTIQSYVVTVELNPIQILRR